MFIGPCIIVIFEGKKTNLKSLAIFFFTFMYSTCFGHQYIHHQELATLLLTYHIGRFFLSSLCVGDLMWLGLSSVRAAG